jgi:diketogulonate reductase-like aldo/keto reductase
MNNLSPASAITLANGVKIPVLGFSIEEIAKKSYNIRTQTELILEAIQAGFRYFDTAEDHGGLRALGRAIKMSGIPREEFFISSKMRLDEMVDGRFNQAIDETLLQLEMDYLDLYCIHWPGYLATDWPQKIAFIDAYCGREIKKTDNGDTDGLIQFYQKGLARAVGVCNLEIHHMEELLGSPKCTVKPMINQSHFHPLHACTELREYCEKQEIAFGGLFEENELYVQTKPRMCTDVNRFGLLYQTDEDHIKANYAVRIDPKRRSSEFTQNPNDLSKNPRREKGFFDDCEGITKIARKYGKTNGQVVSRWSMQHGVVTTVKAFLPDQIRSEYNVFDFVLSDEDMRIIDGFNIGMRFGYHPDYIDF